MPEKTQMTPPDDPNRTQMADMNRTQMASSSFADSGRTMMAGSMNSLSLEIIPERKHIYTSQMGRVNIMAKLHASGTAFGARMPVNLCLILDRSGSMEGEPLEYVKRACCYVVDLLEPTDVLSVVSFEDTAQVIMPARRVMNKALIKEHIQRLQVGNTTNLYDGIALGASQVASAASPAYVNRAILLTDGDPTTGIKDFASIIGQVVEQKSRGITITALGFGPEYNEELLAAMAKRSGGNYYYIMRPDLIPEIFRKELESLMMSAARNVRLRVQMSRWVQLRQVYGKQPTFGHRTAEVTLSDLERGEVQTAVMELELDARPGGQYRVARIEIVYDDSATGKSETVSQDIVLNFTTETSLLAQPVDPSVQREVELVNMSLSLERTVMGMRTQQVSSGQAMDELNKTRMMLMDQGRTMQAGEIQKAMSEINKGAAVEKTMMGAIIGLDREKKQ